MAKRKSTKSSSDTYSYGGNTYVGGGGLTAKQVASQYNPSLRGSEGSLSKISGYSGPGGDGTSPTPNGGYDKNTVGFLDGSTYNQTTGKQTGAPGTNTQAAAQHAANGGNMSGVPTTPTANPLVATPAPAGMPTIKPLSNVAVTSDPARAAYDKLGQMINKPFDAPTTAYGGKLLDNNGLLDQRRVQLEDRKNAELERIRADFDAAEKKAADTEKREVGTSSMNLARIGGFDSASGQAVLTNLERVHVEERQALIAKRENAMLMAQQAYEDKDFALAQLQVQEAKEAEERIYQRQKDFVEMSLAFKQDERADAQFQFQKQQAQRQDQRNAADFALKWDIRDPFYLVGGIGYDTSTGEALSYEDYIERGGAEDFSNAFVVDPNTQAAKEWVANLAKTYPDAGIIIGQDDALTAANKLSNSKLYRKDTYIAPSSNDGIETGSLPSDAKIKNWIYKNKQENPDQPWYELWGELSDEIQNEWGVSPSNYDQLFWEILHPEGAAGYKEYKSTGKGYG